MSHCRFKKIRRILRFDNPDTHQARLARDKLAAVRLLIEGFQSNSHSAFIPGECVTVDEQLYPFRGRCRYRQYMPNKPAKYGLKFWLLCENENFYCYNLQFYCGKEDERPSNIPLGEHVVMSLSESLKQSGRNITCDNFFTSLSLANNLNKSGLTLVGTMKSNRCELPANFRTPQINLYVQPCKLAQKIQQRSLFLFPIRRSRTKW